LAGAVKTSGAKGVHVFVPVDDAAPEDVADATRALAARAEALDPEVATTSFIVQNRGGKVFVDSTRPAARRSPPATARGCDRGYRCPFRWTGPTSTESRLATSRFTRRSMHSPNATRGRVDARPSAAAG